VVKLISVRFPNLCAQVLPVIAPVELAAKKAREEAVLKTGYNKDEIGIFFISPCPAKVTAAKAPLIKSEGFIDGVISASEVYTKLLNFMNKIITPEPLSKSGIVGLAWANSGGESAALLKDKYLAADGIENVIKVLEEIEDEKLNNLDFVELNACTGGCVGGVLNIENPFVAKARLLRLRKYLPISCNKLVAEESESLKWKKGLKYSPVMLLNEDVSVAMEMMRKIDEIANNLPGLDCGSCGAPSCKAFAEDIVKGLVCEDDCIIKMREKLKALNNEEIIPAPFRT
jgi:hypothetical protein